MSRYIICCPNCGNQNLEMIDYIEFECSCGENFDIERASTEEIE